VFALAAPLDWAALPPSDVEATVTGAFTFTGAFAETAGLAEVFPACAVPTDWSTLWPPDWLDPASCAELELGPLV
jgi:hypothetical protein